VHKGRSLESAGDALVISCTLDEAGEEYVAILSSSGLVLVRLIFDGRKLPLLRYYEYVERYAEIYGLPFGFTDSLSSRPSVDGRESHSEETAFNLLRQCARLLPLAEGLRGEVAKHERGTTGTAAVDAAETLSAWKANHTWYRSVDALSRNAVFVGGQNYVLPLKTLPKPADGGNLFIGAICSTIRRIVSGFPRTPAAEMGAALLHSVRRRLEKFDAVAFCSKEQCARIMNSTTLPEQSARFVCVLKEINDETRGVLLAPDPKGEMPFYMPPAEILFQKFAITSVLFSLGLQRDEACEKIRAANSASGATFSNYRFWVDASAHGLRGWRDSSEFPSDYRPDLVILRESDRACLLIDAKLRAGTSEAGLLSASGVKDLQAYMQEYKMHKVAMLVPDPNNAGCQFEDVCGEGFTIRAISVAASFLSTDFASIRNAIDSLWNEALPFQSLS
jgi:hypothetical protein